MKPRPGVAATGWLVVAAGLLAAACAPAIAIPGSPEELPAAPREFRGVWVATVANIDWPSRPGLPSAEQRAELVALLDRAESLNLNAVVLQVRPAADALYPSELEPWSEYLTGATGRAPEPGWDPLAFAIEESHRRGLELHAWFNPFRARHPTATTPPSAEHVARRHPEWVRSYGAYLWMDPGVPGAREHSLAVIRDVVQRYDLDGVHIDDYFYPYPERDAAGAPIPFPDEPSWVRYREGGGRLDRDDWRRDNVDGFVRELYRSVHEVKPWVRVGISPFGVYRPNHPPGQGTAFDQYAELYADPRRWLHEGWLDYMTPQLYWPISRPDLSYPVLLRWWSEENLLGRHLWPGNYTSRTVVGAPTPWRASEVTDQIWVTRGFAGATGNVHFSMRAFVADPDSLGARLLAGPYRARALPPATPWLGGSVLPPPAVELRAGPDGRAVVAMDPRGEGTRWWIVRVREPSGWRVEVLPGSVREHPLAATGEVLEVAVSAVDRLATEGRAARLRP